MFQTTNQLYVVDHVDPKLMLILGHSENWWHDINWMTQLLRWGSHESWIQKSRKSSLLALIPFLALKIQLKQLCHPDDFLWILWKTAWNPIHFFPSTSLKKHHCKSNAMPTTSHSLSKSPFFFEENLPTKLSFCIKPFRWLSQLTPWVRCQLKNVLLENGVVDPFYIYL